MRVTMLPGRIAVMVKNREQGAVQFSDALMERQEYFDRPGVPLLLGEVVAVGRRKGRVVMPPVGQRVYVKACDGLIISPGDRESISSEVPEGFTLRMYGATHDWHDSVLLVTE